MIDQDHEAGPEVPFGRWLLTQRGRGDRVDEIAEAARADRNLPHESDPEAVRAHLRKQQADGKVFSAIETRKARGWQPDG
ncbi:hypothetical protein [Sphingomonas melonis]|uniref:YozE SAM-like domain-containing protein n=1 Tax=Sphingomonas melonis TaxID=152682 RepID=A0A7Y9K0R5_9SPHN|nr:hypothetical protein [Sphingomonas melonis]NYD89162.1 hypothetical protein [Sphingomonas melonis]